MGHSTLPLAALLALLTAHGIRQVADVRRYPASRLHPQFNRETLAVVLSARGIAYRWFEALGGRRQGTPAEISPNRGLTAAGFRQYADYMLTPAFGKAFDDLVAWLAEGPTALLCAEVLWWRCHRRLLSDQLVARGGAVYHLRGAGLAEPHALWDLARVTETGLVYPPPQGELDLTTDR